MIQAINLTEMVQFDKERVAQIVARLGQRNADDVIARTMEELAVQLAKVHRDVDRGLTGEVQTAAAKIAEFSAHIGMPSLSVAAQNVANATQTNCSSALAATTARLDRVGEASLLQVWDL